MWDMEGNNLDAVGDKEGDVEKEFDRLNNMVTDLQQKNNVLKDRNRKHLEEKDRLFTQKIEMEEDMRRLREQVERAEERAENYKQIMHGKEREIENLKGDLERLAQRHEVLVERRRLS
ncbi:unnamed protein product [Amoebophrya sp. A25]|nr:unnamed protein product [Amoebophrya sp. A25]|eukprot:GSA25T00017395001.1